MRPVFLAGRIALDGRDVTDALRAEAAGRVASQIAVHAPLRAALLQMQRDFRRAPGLVADGRDMGTVVFPDAALKVFLTASAEARAQRRYNQLIEKGNAANMATLLQDLRERDRRDAERSVAPLKPASDAYQLDTSAITADEVVALILDWYRKSSVA
jgi:cytidylate kinase